MVLGHGENGTIFGMRKEFVINSWTALVNNLEFAFTDNLYSWEHCQSFHAAPSSVSKASSNALASRRLNSADGMPRRRRGFGDRAKPARLTRRVCHSAKFSRRAEWGFLSGGGFSCVSVAFANLNAPSAKLVSVVAAANLARNVVCQKKHRLSIASTE
jgi:hypothetical protein